MTEMGESEITKLAFDNSDGSNWQSTPATWKALHQFARAIEAAVNAKWEREVAMMKVSEFAQGQEFETRADGKRVRVDRWKTGIRRIVALLWGNREAFEVDEVVDAVRDLIAHPNDDDEELVRAVLDRQAKPVERNFCQRCGKRLGKEEWDIHTCTPPSTPDSAEGACNPHPDAPHGFDRNGSHTNGRYTCTCEGWSPV